LFGVSRTQRILLERTLKHPRNIATVRMLVEHFKECGIDLSKDLVKEEIVQLRKKGLLDFTPGNNMHAIRRGNMQRMSQKYTSPVVDDSGHKESSSTPHKVETDASKKPEANESVNTVKAEKSQVDSQSENNHPKKELEMNSSTSGNANKRSLASALSELTEIKEKLEKPVVVEDVEEKIEFLDALISTYSKESVVAQFLTDMKSDYESMKSKD
jgi:hypothetical protein